jgi:hypothetical protein
MIRSQAGSPSARSSADHEERPLRRTDEPPEPTPEAPSNEGYGSPLVPLLWVVGPLVLLAIYGACS